MPLFSIPLSGLTASSNALSVIANNLANLNTTGYKDQNVTFRDLFYQTIGTNGAGDTLQVGAGTMVSSIAGNFTDGNVSSTGVNTDVAITGDGFFVTDNNGTAEYTRAGNFTTNDAGELTTQSGALVMGYPAINGVVSTNSALSAIQLGKGQTCAPAAATMIRVRTNLDATAAVGSTDADYSSQVPMYDSLGESHTINIEFTKTGSNAWSYSMTIPAADVGATGSPVVLKSGTLTFDGTGKLISPTANITGINITGFANGAANQTFDWDILDSNGTPMLTQVASDNSTSTPYQNGYNAGTLSDFSISQDGTIQGTFTNGRTLAIGQLALASFGNVQGLQRVGDNAYQATLSSGSAAVGNPGSGGRGVVTGGSLELSNVDISQEFTRMIQTQRGFQANAKVITTFDEITQDTINLVR